MCAARWFTANSGLPKARAYALAAQTPTSSAPVSPGPAVTAIASTSARVTPAVASARSTAGTMASRCARLATSGTTPPHRACSAPPEANLGEPGPAVEFLRPGVVHPDLKEYLVAPPPPGLGEQLAQQRGADALAPAVLRHGHRQHVRLAARGEQPGVADHQRLILGHQVVAAVRHPGEFGGEHPLRPRFPAEQLAFQGEHGRQITSGHGAQRDAHDGVTRFGGPGTRASGLRRYNGSAGCIGSRAASRWVIKWASVPAAGYSGSIRSPSRLGGSTAPAAAPGCPAPMAPGALTAGSVSRRPSAE